MRSHSYVTLTDTSRSTGTGAEQLEWSGEVRGVHCGYGTSPFSYYAETPAERGVPKWTGTPEEANHLMRCIARYAGGTQTSFGLLDSQTMKFMWGTDDRYNFNATTDYPYRVGSQYNIPATHRYMINPIIQQNIEGARRGPSNYSGLDVGRGYFQSALANVRMHAFIRTIGYHSTGANGMGANSAWAVWTGGGEFMRHHEVGTPYCGPLFRRANMFLTDLPLAPTRPIDAGITTFCKVCRKCADVCPTTAIPQYEEPRWEITDADSPGGDPDFLDPTRFNNPGKKIWWLNLYACMTNWTLTDTGCGMCQGTCVFSRHGVQSVHGLIKNVVAVTPIFNGFFTKMDEFFGYGPIGYPKHDPDWPNPGWDTQYPEYWAEVNSWWDKPRPIYGLNY
jgi:reductive dehalogenase